MEAGRVRVVGGAPPVREHRLDLHGQRVRYLECGPGPGATLGRGAPVLVLLHGLASDAGTWAHLMPALGRHAHVVAPDLLGFGDSAKPRSADYSVGGHAARLRDLLRELGLPAATVVGHSFGGGVALSFGYQFPERILGLGLVASGGLGPELTPLLRVATLPGAARAARTLAAGPGWLGGLARRAATGLGLAGDSDLDAVARALRSLAADDACDAFTATLRASVGWSGQRMAATDRLHLLAHLPVLLVAGEHDTCIPAGHAVGAHRLLAGSRLAVLDAGHFPHHDHPAAVTDLVFGLLARAAAGEGPGGFPGEGAGGYPGGGPVGPPAGGPGAASEPDPGAGLTLVRAG